MRLQWAVPLRQIGQSKERIEVLAVLDFVVPDLRMRAVIALSNSIVGSRAVVDRDKGVRPALENDHWSAWEAGGHCNLTLAGSNALRDGCRVGCERAIRGSARACGQCGVQRTQAGRECRVALIRRPWAARGIGSYQTDTRSGCNTTAIRERTREFLVGEHSRSTARVRRREADAARQLVWTEPRVGRGITRRDR